MLIVLDFIYEYKLNLREGYGLHYGDGGCGLWVGGQWPNRWGWGMNHECHLALRPLSRLSLWLKGVDAHFGKKAQ